MAPPRSPRHTCPQCAKLFYAAPCRIKRTKGELLCSRKCQTAKALAKPPKPPNTSCTHCGKPFWAKPTDLIRGFGVFCSRGCKGKSQNSGENSSLWNGGVTYNNGYKMIKNPSHPRATKHGYVPEHTLVMEKEIGRYLFNNEEVHHINHIRDDNRIENLELMDTTEHHRLHMIERRGGVVVGKMVPCPICGKEIYTSPRSKRRTCSKECGQERLRRKWERTIA